MTKRTYTTGEKPVSPLVEADLVYILDDIREEPADPEHPEVKTWSFIIVKTMTPKERINELETDLGHEKLANLDNSELIMDIYAILEEKEVA